MQSEAIRMALPEWAAWNGSTPYTVGLEEEVMLLDPRDWGLAHEGEQVLADLPPGVAAHTAAETHQATLELATAPHPTAAAAAEEAAALRTALARELSERNLRAACAGTHPLALWTDTRVSGSSRYQVVYDSMRELARREPTFALHVHIGVAGPEQAIALQNRLRTHLPVLLALSCNSPYWQARDTGLASARTPIFQAFPRVGIPRRYRSYGHYVATVDHLLRCDAFPAPTFLWWDVRPQPRLGTIEVRVMDAQTTSQDTGALAALVQTIAHLELEEGYADGGSLGADEIIQENRFLAARDGMDASFIDLVEERRVPARELLQSVLEPGRAHAQELGCEDALEHVNDMALRTGADRQRRIAVAHDLPGVIMRLAEMFTESSL
jgi:carboxylate-amine ligase